jgi:trehalose-6-phosphate synthase
MLIVAHMLPLNAAPGPDGRSWSFEWDRDSLLWQLKDGLPEEMEVIYIGCLKVEVDGSDQDEVAATLLENFNCVPAFLPTDLRNRFYHGFCKQMLWPLFHYLLPLSAAHGGRFNRSYWQAYVSVNKVRYHNNVAAIAIVERERERERERENCGRGCFCPGAKCCSISEEANRTFLASWVVCKSW